MHGRDHRALDITDRQAVFETVNDMRPSWVINAAAYNDVDGAEGATELAFAVNATGPGNLAAAAARAGAEMVHISTDYVFDGRKGAPYTELDRADPLSVYGRSKYEGELQVLSAHPAGCVLRTAWLYGKYGANFVKAILSAADRGSPLKVVSDQVGSPTWPFMFSNENSKQSTTSLKESARIRKINRQADLPARRTRVTSRPIRATNGRNSFLIS